MGWVRCHKRFGARLALAALALQIVLSFGHVHLDHAAPGLTTVATSGVAITQASRQAPTQNPTDDDDDYCAICASIYLASTSFVALPPQLPAQTIFVRVAPSYSDDFSVVPPRHVAFQSRAPPAV
jgi:hypothetical protein